MRNLLMIAAAIAGAGVFMAQMADRMSPTPALAKGADKVAANNSAADPFFPKTTISPTGGTRVSLPRDFRGHFQATGRIEIKGIFEQREAATDRRIITPLQLDTAAQ